MAEVFTIINKIDDRVIVVVFDRLHVRAGRLSLASKNIGEDLLRSTESPLAWGMD